MAPVADNSRRRLKCISLGVNLLRPLYVGLFGSPEEEAEILTGNSGGGTVSLLAAACATRISVSVSSRYFDTFAGSLGSIAHCDYNYVPGVLRLGEMHDVAGLIAPRHFLAVAGREDHIFPIAHTEAAFAQLVRVYQTLSVPECCEMYVGAYRYYKERV